MRKITLADIEDCKQQMTTPMDTTLLIDVYFQKIDDCFQHAVNSKVAYTVNQIFQ